jgi:hypothetical protein
MITGMGVDAMVATGVAMGATAADTTAALIAAAATTRSWVGCLAERRGRTERGCRVYPRDRRAIR